MQQDWSKRGLLGREAFITTARGFVAGTTVDPRPLERLSASPSALLMAARAPGGALGRLGHRRSAGERPMNCLRPAMRFSVSQGRCCRRAEALRQPSLKS